MKTWLSIFFLLLFNQFCKTQSLSDLYQQVHKSVVVITTEEKSPSTGLERKMLTSEGLGSGVLFTDKGDILTAAHVVHNAENILVGFSDGTQVPAKVVGSVVSADLAHIKLDWVPEGSVLAKLGDSDAVGIGDEIFIIGAPYGIERTLSVGHISGRHEKESISEGLAFMEFLQTDAVINTGNSGGPMFNMSGEVIGIVSYILSETGGYQGLGFVVTSNVAKLHFIEQKAFWTGFESIIVEGELAQALNVPQSRGLLVERVVANSPADEMGLKGGNIATIINEEEILIGGDIILGVDHISLESRQSLFEVREHLISLSKGDMVTLIILRSGKTMELKSTKLISQ